MKKIRVFFSKVNKQFLVQRQIKIKMNFFTNVIATTLIRKKITLH